MSNFSLSNATQPTPDTIFCFRHHRQQRLREETGKWPAQNARLM